MPEIVPHLRMVNQLGDGLVGLRVEVVAIVEDDEDARPIGLLLVDEPVLDQDVLSAGSR